MEFHRWAMKFQLLLHPPFGTSFLRKPPTRPCPTRSGWAVLNISVYKDSSCPFGPAALFLPSLVAVMSERHRATKSWREVPWHRRTQCGKFLQSHRLSFSISLISSFVISATSLGSMPRSSISNAIFLADSALPLISPSAKPFISPLAIPSFIPSLNF